MCQGVRIVPNMEWTAFSLITMVLTFDLQGPIGPAWNGPLDAKVPKRPEGDGWSPHSNTCHVNVAVIFVGSPNSNPLIRCQAGNRFLTEKESDTKTNHEIKAIHEHVPFLIGAERQLAAKAFSTSARMAGDKGFIPGAYFPMTCPERSTRYF